MCVYDSEGASRLCLCLCVRGYNTDTNAGTPTPLLFLFLCRHGHSQSRVLAGVFSRWQSYKTCSILLKCRQSHLSLCLTTRAVSVWSSCTSRHRRLKGVSLHFQSCVLASLCGRGRVCVCARAFDILGLLYTEHSNPKPETQAWLK